MPIAPQCSADFIIDIFAEADFICPVVNPQTSASTHSTSIHPYSNAHSPPYSSNLSASGHASLPSRVGSPSQQSTRRHDNTYSSFRSTASTSTAQHSIAALDLTTADTSSLNQAQHIDAQIRIKYSGGAAMQDGYCRQCAIYFKLELIHSAQITSWDVLPAEM